ncbi:MAG: preprotein translocase subunit SecG [Bryobacteraceae bacterium]
MLAILLTVVHVVVCLFLIIVVLLQSGKAADLAGAFGGMGSQTAFGPRGSATLLSKATTWSAILFMVTSLSLSILATRASRGGGSTVLEGVKPPAPTGQQTPAQPAPAPGQQPTVTLSDPATGQKVTMPVDIPVPPPSQPVPKGGQLSTPIEVPGRPPAQQPPPAPAQK